MTQKDRVLSILKQRTNIGVTSQELRDLTHIVDIPKVISTLRDEGHPITDKPVKLGESFIKRYWLGKQESSSIQYVYDHLLNKHYKVINGQWIAL